jgi:ribonuclease P protein component
MPSTQSKFTENSHEKNISAQRPETQAHTRFSLSHGHQGRPPGFEPSPRQGSQTSRRIRDSQKVSGQATDAGFDKARRLLNAQDYSRVFDCAEAKASHKHLLLLARRNRASGHRLGLVIAKKNVKLAVQRNRVKRVAREFFRNLPRNDDSMDVVLLARRGIDQLDNTELSSILQQQWQKLDRHLPKQEPRRDT